MSFQATPEFVNMIMLERREEAERQRLMLAARRGRERTGKPRAWSLRTLVQSFAPRGGTTAPVCQAC